MSLRSEFTIGVRRTIEGTLRTMNKFAGAASCIIFLLHHDRSRKIFEDWPLPAQCHPYQRRDDVAWPQHMD